MSGRLDSFPRGFTQSHPQVLTGNRTSHKVKDLLATLPPANTCVVRADLLGSSGEHGIKITTDAATLIPILETHIEKRCLTPGPCSLFNHKGWDSLINAIILCSGKPPKANIVVEVQD